MGSLAAAGFYSLSPKAFSPGTQSERAALYCTTAFHCTTALHRTALNCSALHCTAQKLNVLNGTAGFSTSTSATACFLVMFEFVSWPRGRHEEIDLKNIQYIDKVKPNACTVL